jgi:hypothetical protein
MDDIDGGELHQEDWRGLRSVCRVPVSVLTIDTLSAGRDPFAVTETRAEQSISGAFQNRHNPLQIGRNRFKWQGEP